MKSCPPFEGPRLKIERAKKHILDFKATLNAYDRPDLIRARPYEDPETGYFRTEFWLSEPIPTDLRLIAADALYNLRSALDQATCCCAIAAGKSPNGTYFPHGRDKTGFEAALDAKCKKVPEIVRCAIAALEPYHGGNGYLLRVLHDLNLVDKHTDLIAVQLAIVGALFGAGEGILPPGEIWRRTKDRFEKVSAAEVDKIDHHIEVAFSVGFADIQSIENQSAFQVLVKLRDLVIETIDIIEDALRHALHNDGTPLVDAKL